MKTIWAVNCAWLPSSAYLNYKHWELVDISHETADPFTYMRGNMFSAENCSELLLNLDDKCFNFWELVLVKSNIVVHLLHWLE